MDKENKQSWRTVDTVCLVLGLLVLALVIVVIVLAVEISKQSCDNNNNPDVPIPAATQLLMYTQHSDQGWPCATRYRAQFAGNDHWSAASEWTTELSPVTPIGEPGSDPLPHNSNPSIRVANATGHMVTFQRQSQSQNSASSTAWHVVEMTTTADPTVFVDMTPPCSDFVLPPTPEPTGDFQDPDGEWCATSYRVAYSDQPSLKSLWSDFVCSSLPETVGMHPFIAVPAPKGRKMRNGQPVKYIWWRRFEQDDEEGMLAEPGSIAPTQEDPNVYVDTENSCLELRNARAGAHRRRHR
jgi:hypothetical protein